MMRDGAGRSRVAALGALVAAAALTGCGSSSSKSSTAPSSSSTATTPAAASPTSTTSAAPHKANGLTAAGTVLKLGQTAKVEFQTTTKSLEFGRGYKFAVTVVSVKRGSRADFKGMSLDGVSKHSQPSYVRVTFKNLSSHPVKTGNDDPTDDVGAMRSGQVDSPIIFEGSFPPCPRVDTPNPLKPGQSFSTCETFFEHGAVKKVGYNGSAATAGSPVIWSS